MFISIHGHFFSSIYSDSRYTWEFFKDENFQWELLVTDGNKLEFAKMLVKLKEGT